MAEAAETASRIPVTARRLEKLDVVPALPSDRGHVYAEAATKMSGRNTGLPRGGWSKAGMRRHP